MFDLQPLEQPSHLLHRDLFCLGCVPCPLEPHVCHEFLRDQDKSIFVKPQDFDGIPFFVTEEEYCAALERTKLELHAYDGAQPLDLLSEICHASDEIDVVCAIYKTANHKSSSTCRS